MKGSPVHLHHALHYTALTDITRGVLGAVLVFCVVMALLAGARALLRPHR